MGKTSIEWTSVPGWDGVRCSRDGQIEGPSGKVLKPYCDSKTGHQHVLIRGKKLRVHHAVLLMYVGPRGEGQIGRHLNDDPADNRVENLAWGTRFENAADRQLNRGYTRGEERENHRLTSDQVELIRVDNRPSRIVAADYGVSHTAILRIRRNERWAA
ncbi:HNH endonuclease [Nocardia farcinica]|uniref:HNH endonuclease n=1 Tax=Nocardia farcinica TaxID=37329 RepID=UPI0024551BE5|nr:HNH endonuclease [Nocardia farcinica]